MEHHYYDLRHAGYSSKHHTGEACIEVGCEKPAGTAWSPYWCAECDIERKKRISNNLCSMVEELSPK